jgi:predicted SprT family Zn-dependent metalloprotease
MELHVAEQLAKRLMTEFGLGNWIFRFDDAKRRFGSCAKWRRTVTLSRDLTLRNDAAQVEDTIRHEIAHGLAPDREGHGEEWKRMCKVTGANPQRCYDEDVEQEDGDWQATCGGCGHKHTKMRRPRHNGRSFCMRKECRAKMGKRFHPLTRLVFRHVNEVFDPTTYAKEVLGIAELKGVVLPGKIMPTPDAYRAAKERMKEQLRKEEEMQQMKDRIAELERKLGK